MSQIIGIMIPCAEISDGASNDEAQAAIITPKIWNPFNLFITLSSYGGTG